MLTDFNLKGQGIFVAVHFVKVFSLQFSCFFVWSEHRVEIISSKFLAPVTLQSGKYRVGAGAGEDSLIAGMAGIHGVVFCGVFCCFACEVQK